MYFVGEAVQIFFFFSKVSKWLAVVLFIYLFEIVVLVDDFFSRHLQIYLHFDETLCFVWITSFREKSLCAVLYNRHSVEISPSRVIIFVQNTK